MATESLQEAVLLLEQHTILYCRIDEKKIQKTVVLRNTLDG